MPATNCSSVLLPEPFSPTMQNVSPRLMSKLTSCSAQKSLWNFRRLSGQQFLQPVAGRVVDGIAFRNTLKFDGVHGGARENQCNARLIGDVSGWKRGKE